MRATDLLILLGVAATLAGGLRMALRPHAYLGTGIPPATDPRTVRFFGILMWVFAGIVLLLAAWKALSVAALSGAAA